MSVRLAIITDECGKHWFIIERTFFFIFTRPVISAGDIGSRSEIFAPRIISILNGPLSGLKVILSLISIEKWSHLRLGTMNLWDTLRFNSTHFTASSFKDEDLHALMLCK